MSQPHSLVRWERRGEGLNPSHVVGVLDLADCPAELRFLREIAREWHRLAAAETARDPDAVARLAGVCAHLCELAAMDMQTIADGSRALAPANKAQLSVALNLFLPALNCFIDEMKEIFA